MGWNNYEHEGPWAENERLKERESDSLRADFADMERRGGGMGAIVWVIAIVVIAIVLLIATTASGFACSCVEKKGQCPSNYAQSGAYCCPVSR